ncbi:MAG: hypothetical protein P8Q36_02680, partial [Alphaproteobacteria bacterium]|nr:hypothetical protein [Alphaproteobacteria bacterium]
MTLDNSDSTTNSALQGVLMAMIDPINQVFFHSRMLRAWGHSEGMARNMEWIFKMRRTGELVGVMHKHGVGPCDRPALDIAIGHDARSVLEADAAQGRWFIALVEDAHEKSGADDAKEILSQILAAERADLALLESWLQGREADEVASNVKHLRPKPGGEEAAIAALNAALPAMTSAVSQVFFHSLIFKG